MAHRSRCSCSPVLGPLIRSVLSACRCKYGKPVGVGRNRAVFVTRSGRFVVKAPLNDDGLADNQYEATRASARCARSRAAYLLGIPLVVAERVCLDVKKPYPHWVDGVDCGQVGYNRKGRLVAYDFGIR